jgi:hypothetical protein
MLLMVRKRVVRTTVNLVIMVLAVGFGNGFAVDLALDIVSFKSFSSYGGA